MPVAHYTTLIQGTLVQPMITDGSVLPYRFVSIIGPMTVGLTRVGMLGIGVMVSPGPSDGGNGLVQSTGLASVLVDKEVCVGDPVCIGPDGGIMPIEANGHLVGIAVKGGGIGDRARVWLNIAPDFESAVIEFAERRLAIARRAIKSGATSEKGTIPTARKRYVSLDG